jgi:hypothetical protein
MLDLGRIKTERDKKIDDGSDSLYPEMSGYNTLRFCMILGSIKSDFIDGKDLTTKYLNKKREENERKRKR